MMRGYKRKRDAARTGEDGVTLVELTIVLALLGLVIGVIYQYYHYGWGSFSRAEAAADAQMQARNTVSRMDNEVRNGIIANDDGQAVIVSSDGRQLTIYSYVTYQDQKPEKITYQDQKPEKITYQLQPVNSTYFRLLKCIQTTQSIKYPYTYASLPSLPKSNDNSLDKNLNKLNCWMTVISRVENDHIFNSQPDLFLSTSYTADDIIVQVDIQVNDRQHQLPKPVEVKSILTVRSQGVKAN